MTANIDLKGLEFGEVIISGKGGKSVPITSSGQPLIWTPAPQVVQFEPSSFSGEDVSRVNLVCKADDDVIEQLTALDDAIIGLASLHSLKLFNTTLSESEVRARYNSSLKTSEKGYGSTFKTKVNLKGLNSLKCWDLNKNTRPQPDSWVGCKVQPRISVKSLWLMSKEFGVCTTAAML